MAETNPPESITTPESGRHSRKRKARKRRAGDSVGALADGSLEQRLTVWLSAVVGAGLLIGQVIITKIVMPVELPRALAIIVSLLALSGIIIWLDLLRSKKRNPRPRWMRGVLIAGFLFFSVALGSLIVLTMSANPIEDGSFSGTDGGAGTFGTQSHFDVKMLQLKFAIFHILTAVGGLTLLAHVFGNSSHRRSGRASGAH
jgi:hypothetical protein